MPGTDAEGSGNMPKPNWDIRNKGRAWKGDEAWERYQLTPHKIELIKGKLLWSSKDRETLLGLPLENVGADRVVRLGGPEVWRRAVAKMSR
jgi:hypothetical protein